MLTLAYISAFTTSNCTHIFAMQKLWNPALKSRYVSSFFVYFQSLVAFCTLRGIPFPRGKSLSKMQLFYYTPFISLFISVLNYPVCCSSQTNGVVSLTKSLVWGPGLKVNIVLPVRYFFIQPVDSQGHKYAAYSVYFL